MWRDLRCRGAAGLRLRCHRRCRFGLSGLLPRYDPGCGRSGRSGRWSGRPRGRWLRKRPVGGRLRAVLCGFGLWRRARLRCPLPSAFKVEHLVFGRGPLIPARVLWRSDLPGRLLARLGLRSADCAGAQVRSLRCRNRFLFCLQRGLCPRLPLLHLGQHGANFCFGCAVHFETLHGSPPFGPL